MGKKLKNVFLNGLIYGVIFFALSSYLGILFNLPLNNMLMVATLMAVAAITVNGLIYSRFTKSQKTLEAITVTLEDVETLKLQAPANYTIDEHLVSGKLFLTDKRLVFNSHEQKQYSFPLIELSSFKFHPSIVNKGGVFIAADNNNNQFVFEVDAIKLWKKELLEIKKNVLNTTLS